MEEISELNRAKHYELQEYFLGYIKRSLRAVCSWPETNSWISRFFFVIIMISSYTVVVMQQLFVFKNFTNIDYVIGAYFEMIAILMLAVKCSILYYHRNEIIRLLSVIREDFWPLNSFEQLDNYWMLVKGTKFLIVVYCVSGVIVPQILMYFPYIDDVPGQKVMPLLCVYPYDINKTPYYEMTYVWFVFTGVSVGLGVPGFDLLFVYFQVSVCLQFRLLKHALLMINIKYGQNLKSGTKEVEEDLYKKLTFCIEYHQKLIKFHDATKKIYEMHNAFELTTAGSVLCCLTYLFQNETDPEKIIKLILYYFCATLNPSVYCLSGSLIEAETEDLHFAIFNSGWENRPQPFQKTILFMMKMAQVPRSLTAGKLLVIGNMTLITMFKTAFSVSVLLKDKQNEV